MEELGSFIFHERNYLQSSFSSFQEMRIRKEHTDVEIEVRNRSFQAHRVVLAARIPHFHKILRTQGNKVIFNEIDPDVMESVINFAYEGKLKITAKNVQQVFFAAVCFHLTQVQQVCLSFLAKRSNASPVPSSFIKAIPSDDSMRDKFEEFCNSEEFLFLPYFALKELLSRNDLKVRNEEIVFEALIKWTKVSLVERQHWLPYLLAEIRMNYLSSEYLIDRVAAEGLIKMSDQCKDVVDDAKNYFLVQKRVISRTFNTKPRAYNEVSSENIEASTSVLCKDAGPIVPTNGNSGRADAVAVVATNQNAEQGDTTIDVTNHSASEGDLTVAVTAKHVSFASNVKNANGPYSERVKKNFSNGIKQGIYALRSFTSIGTFVSYYDRKNRRWDNFVKHSHNDDVLHVASVKDKLYVFFPNSLETFNLLTDEWTVLLEPLQHSVKGSGIASHENIIYIFGGLHFCSKIRCFDTQQDKWLQDEVMKYPCRNMSVASSPGKHVFLTGGYDTSCYNTFLRFHTITKQWAELTPMICPRMDHASAVLNDKVYVCGGRNNIARFLSTAEVFDKDQWSFISYPKIPRHSLSLLSCGTRLYSFGGMTEKENCSCDVETYHPDINKWNPDVPVPPHDTRISSGLSSYHLPSPCPAEEIFPAVICAVVVQPEQ